MVKCNETCAPACDFCIHITKNEEVRLDGESLCKLHNKVMDWGGYCEEFHCFLVKEGDANAASR